MKVFSYVIKDELGLHARPAGLLAKEVKKFESKITITRDGKSAAAAQLILVMSMAIKKGDEVTVSVEGADEVVACAAMETFFKENL